MAAPELTKVYKILNRMVNGTNPNVNLIMSNYSIQKLPVELLHKKAVLKNFTRFIEKYKCQSLFFNKVAVNFAKFLRTPFLTEYRRWLFMLV